MKTSVWPIAIVAFATAVGCGGQNILPSSIDNSVEPTAVSIKPPAAKPSAKIALDQLFVFENPATCELGDAGYRTISSLIELPGDGRILAGKFQTSPAFQTAFGEPRFERVASDYHRAAVPVFGPWNGLHLIRLESGFIGNDGTHFDFVFEEPFEKVRSTLNGLGFNFDTDGSQGDPPLEGFEAKLSAKGSTTILSCSR
jgi:hypothetical protein